jgi:hypothetical protein
MRWWVLHRARRCLQPLARHWKAQTQDLGWRLKAWAQALMLAVVLALMPLAPPWGAWPALLVLRRLLELLTELLPELLTVWWTQPPCL